MLDILPLVIRLSDSGVNSTTYLESALDVGQGSPVDLDTMIHNVQSRNLTLTLNIPPSKRPLVFNLSLICT